MQQLLIGGVANSFRRLKRAKKRFSSCRSDSFNLIENRADLPLAAQLSVILNGKSMNFVLYPCQQLKTFRVPGDRYLTIIEIQSTSSVVIVFHHAGNRYVKTDSLKDLKRNMDLSFSAVHQNNIGQISESFRAFSGSHKSPGKNLVHTGVIIGSDDPFDLELSVIVLLRLPFHVHDHGADGIKSADIGNIIGFNAVCSFQSEKRGDFLYSADGPQFLTLQSLSVSGQHQFCILMSKRDKLFFHTFLGDADPDPGSPLIREPLG